MTTTTNIVRCGNIPAAHSGWTEDIGIGFVNPPATTESYSDEFGPLPLCDECADDGDAEICYGIGICSCVRCERRRPLRVGR